jgi:trigger factor
VVEEGDVIIASYQGVGDGKAAEIKAEEQQLNLAAPEMIDGFVTGMPGAKIGETKRIELTLPEEFSDDDLAGQTIELDVTVSAIQRREVPELTDAFVQEVSGFDTVDEYRASVRERIENERTERAERSARSRLIGKITDAHPVELPKEYVRQLAREQIERMVGPENMVLFERMGEQLDELLESQAVVIRPNLHQSIVLSAIREAEGLDADDAAVDAWIEEEAERTGDSVARLRARFSTEDARRQLTSELSYRRVTDWLWEQAAPKKVAELTNPEHGEPGHVHGPDCDHDHDHE